jgi:translation initiation factor 2 beta subunit (eIF-2beta)/eIF-5
MEQGNKVYLTSDENVLYDFNYRYVIPSLIYEIINNKGTKITILVNYINFCELLHFDKDILIKIIGKKLSCKAGIHKTSNLYYLQGDFNKNTINNIIYEFIREYLLCNSCDKPEVKLKYKKSQIRQKCCACGYKGYIVCNELIDNILEKNKDKL